MREPEKGAAAALSLPVPARPGGFAPAASAPGLDRSSESAGARPYDCLLVTLDPMRLLVSCCHRLLEFGELGI
jgi:hypothetical protein